MAKRSMFVGMDVHKESIDVSIAEEGRDGEVRHYGVIAGDLEAVAKVVRALRAPTRRLRFVYEAGPCGFGIHRYLTAQGEDCVVVNPSSMPKRSGDRIKTDRRDGDALARLHRAGELTAIYIPTPDDEALRDLVRAREDAVGLSTQAKHRVEGVPAPPGSTLSGTRGVDAPLSPLAGRSQFPARAAAHRAAGIPRHDRRNRAAGRAAHRATPAAHARVALGAGRGCAAGVTRCLVCHGGGPGRRSRRHPTLRPSAGADGVSRPRAVGVPRAGPASAAAGSPRRAIRTRGACSPKRPGRIRACRGSAGRPSKRVGSVRSGRVAGPVTTWPSVSKVEPWQGQSSVWFSELKRRMHAMWVHRARTARKLYSRSRAMATGSGMPSDSPITQPPTLSSCGKSDTGMTMRPSCASGSGTEITVLYQVATRAPDHTPTDHPRRRTEHLEQVPLLPS